MYKNYTKTVCTPTGYIKKILLVMKITTFFLFAAIMQVSATAVAQRLTLVQKDATLKEVFAAINTQTGYNIFWSDSQINANQKVNANFKDTPLLEVLDKCLENTRLTYTVENKTVVIKQQDPSLLDKFKSALGIPVTISGKVHDETGQPMPGVTVKQKDNPNNGTFTDSKGAYSLTVSDNNSVITFSFIGYETQELSAKDIFTGSVIILKASVNNLKEVVVDKGYYKERRELSTGDVGMITSKEIEEQPVADPIQTLIGRVAGLNIQQTSGIPGSYATIRIRGQNSIANGNDPLYIVDGVPFNSSSPTVRGVDGPLGTPDPSGHNVNGAGLSPFSMLNPSDIENIELLKDADATAIYGSRGANGVILITTKKGKTGDTKVNLNLQQGVGQVGHFMDLLNTQQYLQMRHEAFKNDGLSPDPGYDFDLTNWDTTRYTNWQKVLIGNTARYTDINGSISGGNTNTQFLLGGGYNRQTTVFPGDYPTIRGSLHLSLTHSSANQKFHAQFTASYGSSINNTPPGDPTGNIALAPDAPTIYNKDGSINWQLVNGSFTWNNPLAYTVARATAMSTNLNSDLELGYQLLPGLQLKTDLGYTRAGSDQNLLQPASAFPPPYNTNPALRSNLIGTSTSQTWIVEPQLNYQKKIAKGLLDVLIGTTFQQNTSNSMGEQAFGFASDALINTPQAATNFQLISNNYTLYHYNAFYGRIGYNWDEKYLLNLTARRDGSSRFGPGNQFGNFGAIGAGWIFSKEKPVADNLPWLSFGKLRASFGTTGNDQLTDYKFLSTYNSNSNIYQGITQLAPTSLTNPNFRWEEVKKLEGGIDLGFLKDRINLEVSYYRNQTVNQLVGEPLASVAGFTTVEYNLPAVIQNSGLEVNLNTTNIKTADFNWTTSANFTLPSSKLVSFPGITSTGYENIYEVGQSLFAKHFVKYTGVNPQTGVYTYATKNADGIPTFPGEYIFSPPVTQKFYGGLQNSFTYKGFRLDVFFQFVKQLGYNYLNAGSFEFPGIFNQNEPTAVLARWQKSGDISTVPKFSTQYSQDPPFLLSNSTAILSDASFIRLKNVSLSYNLPKTWQDWTHMQNARIFLQGQNLLTFTHYLGLDPETGALGLPPLRVITMGVSASF